MHTLQTYLTVINGLRTAIVAVVTLSIPLSVQAVMLEEVVVTALKRFDWNRKPAVWRPESLPILSC